MAQIKSASLPEQNAVLTQLLINVKCKILSLRKAEKTRKHRWLIKKAKNEFNVNLYKARKKLLDPKCCCSLKVDQEVLDQHKSSNLFDNNYDIPLGNLEGLPPEPLLLKKTYFTNADMSIKVHYKIAVAKIFFVRSFINFQKIRECFNNNNN